MGEKLFEEWRVYEKLLIHDYMDHQKFFGRMREEILRKFQRPIRILDLGCGDMTPLLPLLQSVPLSRYVGIDESEGALAIAKQRLTDLDIPGELIHGDILSILATLQESFDLAIASFSLHHLAEPGEKLHTLQALSQRLGDDGMFALIDVFCAEQESRNSYVERWIAHADWRYATLQPEEKQLLFDHVRARDNPVSEKTWQSLGRQSGFERVDVLLRDDALLNGLVIFTL